MVRKTLDRIPKVSPDQVAFGQRLGLNLSECTVNVAFAAILDEIDRQFWVIAQLGCPTEKQVAFAAKYGYDISRETRRVGGAVVNDIMTQLNLEAVDSQDLKPGDKVVNRWDMRRTPWVISSIREDGEVFFGGGNGRRAWARNLRKVTSEESEIP